MESTHETASTDKQRTVLEAVAEMIVTRGIGVGERLPPELDLARDLGVARSTVREALKAWQGMGVVSRNKGAGTVLPVPISGKSMQVRRPIEVEACRLAALRANDRQRAEIIHRAYVLIDALEAGDDWRPKIHSFHHAIHDAAGSSPVRGMATASRPAHPARPDARTPAHR